MNQKPKNTLISRRNLLAAMAAGALMKACDEGSSGISGSGSGGGGGGILPPGYTYEPHLFSGFCYSPFRDGQDPDYGIFPSESQVREDISIISRVSSNIRTYGNNNVLFEIPRFCGEKGVNCYPGAWISGDLTENANSINRAIQQGNAGRATTKGVVIGNEVLLRGDIPKSTLLNYIANTKNATATPVATAEPWSVWLGNPDLVAASDFIFAHVHPYWENNSINAAAQFVADKYAQLKQAYPGKQIFIAETGWPTRGAANGSAVPSLDNQTKFWRDFMALARAHSIPYFAFEAFDEKWKEKYGLVEGSWGLWNSDRTRKTSLDEIIDKESAKIAFEVYNYQATPTRTDIWIVNPDGSGLKKMPGNPIFTCPIKFSPDGNALLFRDDSPSIKITDLDGNTLHDIPNNVIARDYSWQADGMAILFGGYGGPGAGIYRYNLNTKAVTKLTPLDNRLVYYHEAVTSPGMDKIAFAIHSFGTNVDIRLMGMNGENLHYLATGLGPTDHDEPICMDWLDNQNLIFKIETQRKIYRINAQDGTIKESTTTSDNPFSEIKLSPDRKILCLTGGTNGSKIANVSDLDLPTIPCSEIGSISDRSTSWAEDSLSLLVNAYKSLYLADVNGGQRQILDNSVLPDPSGIVFHKQDLSPKPIFLP